MSRLVTFWTTRGDYCQFFSYAVVDVLRESRDSDVWNFMAVDAHAICTGDLVDVDGEFLEVRYRPQIVEIGAK